MPVSGGIRSCGLALPALVALVLLPSPHYVPELCSQLSGRLVHREPAPPPRAPPSPAARWLELVSQWPPLDLALTAALLLVALIIYVCGWIQRKLMEKRISKLNEYLTASVERLRERDVQQEQLDTTLGMVQRATAEYNLLLYLLLRHHRHLPAGVGTDNHTDDTDTGPASYCLYAKDMLDDADALAVLTRPACA